MVHFQGRAVRVRDGNLLILVSKPNVIQKYSIRILDLPLPPRISVANVLSSYRGTKMKLKRRLGVERVGGVLVPFVLEEKNEININ